MNPADAAERGIRDGCLVRISSDTGEIKTCVELTEDIIRGAACLDCSYSNKLTTTVPTLPSSGSRTHSIFVNIEPA